MIIAQSILISANVLEVHRLELAHNLAKVWSPVRVVIPASLHQVEEWTWRVPFRDFRSKAFLNDTLTDNLSIDTVVGRLARCQLPHNHAEREHIGLFSVLEAFDDFRCHPLIGSNLAGHNLGLDPGPAEVSQFCCERMVKQNVQTFQVTMQNWLL